MYAVCVTFRVRADAVDAFLPRMLANAETSLATEAGCHQFDVCREGNEVFLYELYADRAAFDAHLDTAHFRDFDAATADMIEEKTVKTYGWRKGGEAAS
ncbi:putative quinol monooxygenase [Pseudaestuariivita atlantica]|uniref:Antibiotic biosynthesis monooxygenase n=1 Tax=Pseudaestuariivita atlantica TaxID=1317121 RepID=A0A0L1JNH0_9RHOB|nr:putative quinol monooxygenase [Pseudaestuariivita atlantica]KNG93304.1 antibiotic biosynthesis monooxygenase [Pseudaestuariivita atlantica]